MPRNDNIDVKGFIKTLVYDTKNKRVVGYREVDNLVVTNGRNAIANLIVGGSPGAVTHGHVGTSTTAPAAGDSNLTSSLVTTSRKTVATSTAAIGTAQFTWSYDTNEFIESVSGSVFGEIGLFNSSAAGTIYAHATFPQTTKDSNMQISFTYQLRFSTATG